MSDLLKKTMMGLGLTNEQRQEVHKEHAKQPSVGVPREAILWHWPKKGLSGKGLTAAKGKSTGKASKGRSSRATRKSPFPGLIK